MLLAANLSLFRMAPLVTSMLSLVARDVVPFDHGMGSSDSDIGIIYLSPISSLGVYGIIIAGWSSNWGCSHSIHKCPCLYLQRVQLTLLMELVFLA